MVLKISPWRVFGTLMVTGLFFSLISLFLQAIEYFISDFIPSFIIKLFDVGSEGNLPTFYTSMLFFACSAVLLWTSLNAEKNRRRYAWHWQLLSVVFAFLSMDEMLAIHEFLNAAIVKFTQIGSIPATGQRWDVFSSVLVAFLALAYLKFLIHLPEKTRKLYAISAALVVIGGIGIEFLGTHYLSGIYHQPIFLAEAITTVEEFLEMLGVSLFLSSTLAYLGSVSASLQICIINSPDNFPVKG